MTCREYHFFYSKQVALYNKMDGLNGRRDWRKDLLEYHEDWERKLSSCKSSRRIAADEVPALLKRRLRSRVAVCSNFLCSYLSFFLLMTIAEMMFFFRDLKLVMSDNPLRIFGSWLKKLWSVPTLLCAHPTSLWRRPTRYDLFHDES